jgi:DNA-binding MarR family transcriptional regulator
MSTTAEADQLMEAIRLLVRRFSLAERADVACCGMTVAQAATLEALSDDGLRLGELGQRLGIAPSTLSRNIDRLVDRGLVQRGPDPNDRRAQRAELTAEGRKAATAVRRHESEFARDILDRLPDGSIADTLAAVDNILSAVRAATERCCPGAYDHLFAGSGIELHERTET